MSISEWFCQRHPRTLLYRVWCSGPFIWKCTECDRENWNRVREDAIAAGRRHQRSFLQRLAEQGRAFD